MRNTPNEGGFRYIVFREDETWYAVALEFNIVESADDKKVVFLNLLEAVAGYTESLRKVKGLRDFSSLNQKTDPQYEELWDKLQKAKSPTLVKSPYEVSSFGHYAHV